MRRDAFTLIEVVAATALASVLMVLLLTTLEGVKRTDRTVEAYCHQSARYDRLLALLRHDLRHATSIVTARDGLILDNSYGGLSRTTAEPTHSRARVTYQLEEARLWRLQADLDNTTNRESWAEVVATGVEVFTAQATSTKTDSVKLDGEGPVAPPLLKPDTVNFRLVWDDGRMPLEAKLSTR